jgi:hypothetical protein
MGPDDFRRLALALPEAEERQHFGTPDFRVRGKIFASLGYPDAGWGVLMLTPDDQTMRAEAASEMFTPVKGYWGVKGATQVRLAAADEPAVIGALWAAWRKAAPKKLAAEHP